MPGEAGGAAHGLVELGKKASLKRKYIGGWNKDKVLGKGSKNIPLLQIAHDFVVADRKNDTQKIGEITKALSGYFNYTEKNGHFGGEEYSTIYWRWIVLPVWICWLILRKRGSVLLSLRAYEWLRDFVTICILGSYPNVAEFYLGGVLSVDDKLVSKQKNLGRRWHGVATTVVGGSRSWVLNKGNDNKRDMKDGLSWVEGSNLSAWLSFVLELKSSVWVGASNIGDFVPPITKNYHKLYGKPVLFDEEVKNELVEAWRDSKFPHNLVKSLKHGPTRPMVIGHGTHGTWSVYEESYNDGSTGFMHVRMMLSDLKSRVYSQANPKKRSNSDPSFCTINEDFSRVGIFPRDGKYFDLRTEKETKGSMEISLPSGPHDWIVRIHPGGKVDDLKPKEPGEGGNDSWWDVLLDFFRKIFG